METRTINLIVFRGWHELDDKQLRYLFGLLADDYSSAEIRTLCLLRWSGLKVLFRQDNDFVLSFRSEEFFHPKDDSLIDEMVKVLYSGREARHPKRANTV